MTNTSDAQGEAHRQSMIERSSLGATAPSLDGNTVIVVWDGRGIPVDGKPYENTYAFFMQMRDGKVVDVSA